MPAHSWLEVGEACISNRNGELQQVVVLRLPASVLRELSGEGFETIGAIKLGIFEQVALTAHPACFLLIGSNEAGRLDKVVLLRLPEEVQDQKVVLAGEDSGATANLLGKQAANPGWAQRDYAVDTRFVEAFAPKHGVADKSSLAASKALQHASTIPACAVDVLGSNPALPAKTGELL